MDIFQLIKTTSIAPWFRFVTLFVVLLYFSFAGYVVYHGIFLGKSDIVQLGSSLLGVGFPFLLIILVVSFYDSGTAPLERASAAILDKLVPNILKRITFTCNQDRCHVEGVETIRLDAGSCSRVYRVFFKCGPLRKVFLMALDLNVRKVNLLLLISEQNKINAVGVDGQGIQNTFLPHAIEGAKHEGYLLNPKPSFLPIYHESIAGKYVALVFIKQLPHDFLWNSAEKLYFCQDVLFFVKAALSEDQNGCGNANSPSRCLLS